MASVRKRFNTRGKAETKAHMFAQFIKDLLAGTITATQVHEVKNGRERLEYDDPNG